MFYRRKIILSLLEIFDGRLERLRIQKLLFLFTKRQSGPEYDFIPYKFGCFSYSANADITTMINKGLLSELPGYLEKNDKTSYIKGLKEVDRKLIFEVKKLYGQLDGNALMKHTYVNYPYFAINSVKAAEILSTGELLKVTNAKPNLDSTVLFTIGYEGISLEKYLNKLITNNIRVLVDVRKNPLSMKYGFSKSLLSRFCESVGIQYLHFPEVGIDSNQRLELNQQSDYDKLFITYKKDNLKHTLDTQKKILDILKLNHRIALTCFEANICQCHRKPLAESIRAMPGFEYELKHI
jgi:hypothetical protein